MNLYKKVFLLIAVLFICSLPVKAENVILMIGDGMGFNHLKCVEKTDRLFMNSLPVRGKVKTYSANAAITDSAAGATAYSCGIKTNNMYLAMTPAQKPCETIAEKSINKGYFVGIRTTDEITGATPAAFYAHNISRRDSDNIKVDLKKASQKMNIDNTMFSIEGETKKILKEAQSQDKPFFILIEGAWIDIESHKNKYENMREKLIDFDKAVAYAVDFALQRKDTTVIVVADHETGGLTETCVYTTNKHTDTPVPYFAAGNKSNLFRESVLENTDIYVKMNEILFN